VSSDFGFFGAPRSGQGLASPSPASDVPAPDAPPITMTVRAAPARRISRGLVAVTAAGLVVVVAAVAAFLVLGDAGGFVRLPSTFAGVSAAHSQTTPPQIGAQLKPLIRDAVLRRYGDGSSSFDIFVGSARLAPGVDPSQVIGAAMESDSASPGSLELPQFVVTPTAFNAAGLTVYCKSDGAVGGLQTCVWVGASSMLIVDGGEDGSRATRDIAEDIAQLKVALNLS
jgi:hypothetical protein